MNERSRPRPEGPLIHVHSSGRHASRRLLLVAVGAAIVVGIVLALNLLQRVPGEPLDAPPRDATGTWTTADPRYAGRSLSVSRDAVVLRTGAGEDPVRGRVLSFRRWEEGLVRVLRIEYDAGDGRQILDLLLVGTDSMRLRHPREVLWTRAR